MMEKRKMPTFKSEADEAAWWYAHREETARWMEEAAATGHTTTLSQVLQRARQRSGATPTVSIRIAPEDIARARGLAEKKGLRYQTYLKMLLHEALDRELKRMPG
jgi:predicted DNA binding CopG/RHH family protein